MKPEVGMALLHNNKYEWVIVGVYNDGVIAIKCPQSGVSGDYITTTVQEGTDKLFPNLIVLRVYTRLMGLDIK